MGNIILCPFRALKTFFMGLVFNWQRRRFSWRASFFYNLTTILVTLGIVVSLTLQQLMEKSSFFSNYQCSSSGFDFMMENIIAMMVLTGMLGLCSFLIARLTLMFSNFSMHDFMSTGKWADRLGCMVKWVPWLSAIIFIAWGILNCINIIVIFVLPSVWCHDRWNAEGTVMVQNCRAYHRSMKLNCQPLDEGESGRDVKDCNDGMKLADQKWTSFAGGKGHTERFGGCDIDALPVCLTFLDLTSSTDPHIDWTDPALMYCSGNEIDGMSFQEQIEYFTDIEAVSDLYRYAQMYVYSWISGFVFLTIFGGIIRSITPFDAIFYQAADEGDTIIHKLLRPLTPWSA